MRNLIIIVLLTTIPLIGTSVEQRLKLASEYVDIKNYSSAVGEYENILAVVPSQLHALFGRALCQFNMEHYEHALQSFTQLTSIYPTFATGWYNLAYVARILGQHTVALHAYQKTLEFQPDNENAHLGIAKTYLALADFEHGFEEFEWRYLDAKTFRQQRFDVKLLAGKKVLLRAEWGLGDTIQFIRYAELLTAHGATVYLETFPALVPLLSTYHHIDRVYATNTPLPTADITIPLLSLPYIFNTHIDTIPATIPYLHADKNLIELWKDKIPHQQGILNIGICWHAKPIFLEDVVHTRRSIPLPLFEPLAQLPHVRLYSLQKIHGTQELNSLPLTMKIHDFGPDVDTVHGSFMDTAAIMHHLDLVICADTAIAHLAGALGITTWVLLPYTAEWRWMEQRTDSPWYPNNMRLFRQQQPGDWHTVIHEVCQALKEYAIH